MGNNKIQTKENKMLNKEQYSKKVDEIIDDYMKEGSDPEEIINRLKQASKELKEWYDTYGSKGILG
ncbi:MAG: hypothetical protein BV456_00595 [Thermoplasmata archaeon M8B2D]|nr:MAG: hypothetical protein BV456_00595 [Thermoplasmata archaeon M8B2D]